LRAAAAADVVSPGCMISATRGREREREN